MEAKENDTSASDSNVSINSSSNSEQVRYAGKYDSVDQLEKGYNELYRESQVGYQRAKEAEQRLKELQSIPDQYDMPSDLSLRDSQVRDLKEMARSAGMNQDQFLKAAATLNENLVNQVKSLDQRKKDIGEDNINLLQGYVDQNFSGFDAEFKNEMFNKLIKDDKIMSDALKSREQQMNNKYPGMDKTAAPRDTIADGRRECFELGLKAQANPRDKATRQKFINLCREVGHARAESQ